MKPFLLGLNEELAEEISGLWNVAELRKTNSPFDARFGPVSHCALRPCLMSSSERSMEAAGNGKVLFLV
jgi:hypothetical protein